MNWIMVLIISVLVVKWIFFICAGIIWIRHIDDLTDEIDQLDRHIRPENKHRSMAEYEYNCTRDDLSEYCP